MRPGGRLKGPGDISRTGCRFDPPNGMLIAGNRRQASQQKATGSRKGAKNVINRE
jgi:hypothetical protein